MFSRKRTARPAVAPYLSIGRWALGVGRSAFPLRGTRVNFREKTVINRLSFSPFDFFHISALADPFRAQRRKSLRNIAVKSGVTPRSARVVNAHRLVVKNYGRGSRASLHLTVHRLRRRERDFAERNPNVRMQLAGDINLARIETRSAPASLAASRLGFTFYVARTARSIHLVHSVNSVPNKKAMRGITHG